ncbi:hypothetical protein FRC00_006867 [Tulasnella sp. 408]|nr:hypothetical protein FRC00_006867 [Tulasnella sp. 408]
MHSASGPRWTTRWASPEVLEGGKTTLASDIWALGWVYWEIITDHLPFHHISNDLGVILRITQGELPPVSSNKKLAQLQSMCDLLVGCWQKKPRLRPTATECLEVIEQLPSARPSKIIMNNETGERTRSATLLNALGEMNFDLGNYDMAMNEYSKSLTISKSENDNELSSRVLENIGDIHHSEKRWEDAIDAYEEAHRLAHLAGFEGLHETVLCRLMDSYTEMGWLQEAQEVLDDIIIEPQDNRDWKVVVESLYKLGKASYTQGQYERATLVYQRARYIHRNKNDYVEPLYSLHHIAILYCLHGRYADAEEIFGKLKIVQDPPLASITDILISLRKPARSLDCKEKGDWADVLLRFGISLSNQGRLTGALAVYHEIRNIHELQGCRKEIAGTLQYIGHLYVKLEKYEAAELAYGEGYDICSADGDQPGEVKFLLGLAEVYCIEELYDDAVDTFKQARRISSKGGLAEPLVDTLNRLGEVYRLTEKYKDAAQAFRKAGRVAAEEDYLDGRAKALKGLGMTFADEERYEEALKRLKRAASIFRKIGDTKSLSKCNLAIEEIEEALDIVSDVES